MVLRLLNPKKSARETRGKWETRETRGKWETREQWETRERFFIPIFPIFPISPILPFASCLLPLALLNQPMDFFRRH
ncbi:UNVERIFIED_CONTAM: hypothetical protein BEN50_19575 [Euhalothece sp. KZN 001]